MNVRLLRKVAKHISAEPRRLVMGCFIQRQHDTGLEIVKDFAAPAFPHKFAPCGTAACIAGWAVLLTDKKEPEDVRVRAAQLLGLGTDTVSLFEGAAYRLFETCAWPRKFAESYKKAKTVRGRAAVAVRRIEHFIKTKGKE